MCDPKKHYSQIMYAGIWSYLYSLQLRPYDL